jgi:hypothetical protein
VSTFVLGLARGGPGGSRPWASVSAGSPSGLLDQHLAHPAGIAQPRPRHVHPAADPEVVEGHGRVPMPDGRRRAHMAHVVALDRALLNYRDAAQVVGGRDIRALDDAGDLSDGPETSSVASMPGPSKRRVTVPVGRPVSTKRPEESVVVERFIPTTLNRMLATVCAAEAVTSDVGSALGAPSTVPSIVAGAEGALGFPTSAGYKGEAGEDHRAAQDASAYVGHEASQGKATSHPAFQARAFPPEECDEDRLPTGRQLARGDSRSTIAVGWTRRKAPG